MVRSQSERAYQFIRRELLAAELRPGERLTEIKWAIKVGVGRAAVREALRRLSGEGLVQKLRASHVVIEPAPADIHELRQLRDVLETGALRACGKEVPPQRLKAIRTALHDYEDLMRKGYLAGAREADLRFHQAIVAAPGNARLTRLHESANLPLFKTYLGTGGQLLDDYEETRTEHREIFDHLAGSRIDLAIEALQRHLNRGEITVLNPP